MNINIRWTRNNKSYSPHPPGGYIFIKSVKTDPTEDGTTITIVWAPQP